MDIRVEGADRFAQLSRVLRQVGDKELRRELYAALNRSTKPTKEKVKASLGANLPQRGGLAAVMGRARLSTRSRSGRNPGVRIEAKAGHDIRSMDRGRLKHPVFGNKQHWVSQAIEPGVFSDPIREDLPDVQQELYEALVTVAEKFLDKQ